MSQAHIGSQGHVPYSVVVGRVLQQRRMELGFHQNYLAQGLGITQSAYSRLESGDVVLSVTQLRMASAILQTSPAQVFEWAERYADWLRLQGAQITDDKKDNSAAVLIGLGLLAAAVVALGASSQ